MAYSDKVWKNAPDYTTPLSAAGLNDWEARIKAETDALEVLAESAVAADAAITRENGLVTEVVDATGTTDQIVRTGGVVTSFRQYGITYNIVRSDDGLVMEVTPA